jgi:hypothetical protein
MHVVLLDTLLISIHKLLFELKTIYKSGDEFEKNTLPDFFIT